MGCSKQCCRLSTSATAVAMDLSMGAEGQRSIGYCEEDGLCRGRLQATICRPSPLFVHVTPCAYIPELIRSGKKITP